MTGDRLRQQLIHGLNGHDVDADTIWAVIHRWDALVNIAQAARIVARRYQESETRTPAMNDLIVALSVLGEEHTG